MPAASTFSTSYNVIMDIHDLKKSACDYVDLTADELKEISLLIWNKPELCYEEKYAHELLTTFLEQKGFTVEKSTPLETSFIAKFGRSSGVKIGVLCEYDALPGIGHGCGHNLIAEAGLAAGLALKNVIENNPNIEAEVSVFGTPAEEAGGGKVDMIKAHSFDHADFCMMVHPYSRNILTQPMLAREELEVTFYGKASHAASAPWEGVNALDAAVHCYHAVSSMRQQLKPSIRIHGIITNGGSKPNIIPEKTSMLYYLRGQDDKEVDDLAKRFKACVEGAAMTTGCTFEITEPSNRYRSICYNPLLSQLFADNSSSLGIVYPELSKEDSTDQGSSDMGNVSHVKPSIHPQFAIPTKGSIHTTDFTAAACLTESQIPTLIAGKAMAMTGIDVICDLSKLDVIKTQFKQQHHDL